MASKVGSLKFETSEEICILFLQMDKMRMGVVVGSGLGGGTVFSNGVEALYEKGHKKISPFSIPYIIPNMGSALLAMETGFMGPTYSISTACATSNHCFIAAANHIRRGNADVMVAGGTDAGVTPAGVGGFTACRVLSERNDEPHKASRPWDKDRDGFVMGEGAGIFVCDVTHKLHDLTKLLHTTFSL